jgi:uncharacterized membrane protein
MHPLIAKYLDLSVAVAALNQPSHATLNLDDAALVAAAQANPGARTAVLKAAGSKVVSNDAQGQLIILATRAATLRLAADPVLGPRITTARSALEKEGATAEEAETLLAQAVLEEAFGYAEDPDVFDADYLAETLDTLAQLAVVTQENVDDWLEAFARKGAPTERVLRLKVAEVVLESAWGDGPQPITPEHVDDALERLADTVASSEVDRAQATAKDFLTFLHGLRLLGPQRHLRLERILGSANARDEIEADGADEDE